jgi:hypothetical protein
MMEQQPVLAAERPFTQGDAHNGKAPEFDAAAFGAEHAVKALVEYQVEAMRFLARRTHANLEFMRRLPHCKGWEEVAELQQTWLKDFVGDYGEEAGRFVGTSLQLATSDFVPMQWLFYGKPPRKYGKAPRNPRGNGRAA